MPHSDHEKPRYVNLAGIRGPRELPSAPPFLFREVTYRVFPVKANMARLTDFCDKYLNMDVPASISHFRPALPYVYMMVLNYGSMSAASVRAQNVGWVAQNEVTFTVPLEWWQEQGGRMVFKDWACVSPFIFVDDDMSVATGREIYGWSKIKASVENLQAPLWLEDPRAPTRLFRLQLPVMAKLYAGSREEPRDLVLIDRDPPPSFAMFPPDLGNPYGPLAAVPNALRSWIGLAGEAVDMLTELPIRGYRMSTEGYQPRRRLKDYRTMAWKGAGMMARLLPDLFKIGPVKKLVDDDLSIDPEASKYAELFLNTVTLKQFRDAEDPSQACYQALINSRMGYNRLNRSGLLGDLNMLRGDPSGGFSVRIAQYDAQPIVECLGLEVDRMENGPDAPVAVLKPTFPFWGDVDLYYGKGEVIGWRAPCQHGTAECTTWQPGPAAGPIAARKPDAPHTAGQSASQSHCDHVRAAPRIPFNTVTGAATQSIAGPFHFPDVTIQVYPLLGDSVRLNEFLDNYLNGPFASTELRYEPFGEYVYLMVSVFGDGSNNRVMWSEANNIGWWTDKTVQFCLPVRCYRKTAAGEVLEGIALVTPYVFGNSGRAVISDREVNGRATIKADIETHPDSWLDEAGPIAERRMLRLDTEVFPALYVGQKSVVKTLLELDQHPPLPYEDRTGWRQIAERWRDPLVADLKRKTLFARDRAEDLGTVKTLALEILAGHLPIQWLHLKQYREASDAGAACYQALVKTTRHIDRIYDRGEIDTSVFVRIHQLPDHPIVETLGLQFMDTVSNGEGVVQVLQPIRPFWVRVGIKEDLGKLLYWRTEAGPWQASPHARPNDATTGAGHFGPAVLDLLKHADQGVRESLTLWLRETLIRETNVLADSVLARLSDETRTQLRKEVAGGGDSPAARMAGEIMGICLDGSAKSAIAELFGSHPAEDGYEGMEALAHILRKHGLNIPSDRLSLAAARDSLARMDDLQVAIESLLRDTWKSRIHPHRTGGGEPKAGHEPPPEFGIPSHSFPASIDINGGSRGVDDLRLTPGGHWYCLDLEKQASDPRPSSTTLGNR